MTSPHGYFESLSPELLLPILSHLPDLDSLDSLLRASPAACRVFDTQSATIFKTVLSSGNTHTYTCALIRIIALIRANALPPTVHNLKDFKDLIRHETSPHHWEPPRWDHPPSSWPSDLPTATIRELLVTSRNVQHLTFGCLEYYLDQFRPLRPFNSAGFSYDSTYFAEVAADCIGPWQDKPPGNKYVYPVQDIGPPSWLEEQRVLRVFWRIQLSRDVNAAIDVARIVLPEEEGRLNGMSPADFCDVPTYFFDEKGGVLLEHRKMNFETILEHELLDSAIDYKQKVDQVISESKYWQLKEDWAAGSVPRSEEDWQTLDITWRSNMWDYFYGLSGTYDMHTLGFRSPLQHAKFELWRRFGFAIWSTARMAGYGLLLPRGEYPRGLEKPYYEAWRNLLTEDEKEAVDNENKRWEEELGL